MHTGFEKPQIFLALIASLLILIHSGYLLHSDLAEDDLSSPDANYENADIDDDFVVPVVKTS